MKNNLEENALLHSTITDPYDIYKNYENNNFDNSSSKTSSDFVKLGDNLETNEFNGDYETKLSDFINTMSSLPDEKREEWFSKIQEIMKNSKHYNGE